MKRSVGGSLIPISSLFFGALLLAVAATVYALVFRGYVDSLMRDSETLLDETTVALERSDDRDALSAARLMAPRLFRRTLLMTFVDDRSRVVLYHLGGDEVRQPPAIVSRPREDRSAEPAASGPFAHLVLGCASIAGFHILHTHVNRIDIGVDDNDVVLVNEMRQYIPALIVTGFVIVLLTIVVGSLLNRSALRPLRDVTSALERLALGDFTVQFVESGADGKLGVLARAYNRAVARVEAAFAERDEANSAMRRFVADAGHQLRTPLTVIRGFIAILGQPRTASESAERSHILHVMDQQSLLIASLIDNLILLDRWEQEGILEARPLDVTRLIEDIVARTAEAHPFRRVDLRCPDADEILVRADPTEFTYALTNVLDNALSYTDGPVHIEVAIKNQAVMVEVCDTGPGMPPEVLERACDRFYRGERRDVPGSGLGLAIAKRAVERAGGEMLVRSAVERGTAVAIKLPRILAMRTVVGEH